MGNDSVSSRPLSAPSTVAEWDALAPEEQDTLIASGWHPGPGSYSERALQIRRADANAAYWKGWAGLLRDDVEALREALTFVARGTAPGISGDKKQTLHEVAIEALGKTDRYQKLNLPHNYAKAQRHGNDLGRDTTEVTVMPDQFRSGDTDEGHTRLVGVEDERGRAWCMECAGAEIRRAGETAFCIDLYVTTSTGTARRKCVNCRRPIGEVFA